MPVWQSTQARLACTECAKGIRRENQRLRFSIDDPRGVGIEMATQTIAVGEFFRAPVWPFPGQTQRPRQPEKASRQIHASSGGPEPGHDRASAGNGCQADHRLRSSQFFHM